MSLTDRDLLDGLGATEEEQTALERSTRPPMPDQFWDREQVEAKVEESHKLVAIIEQTRDYLNALPNTKNDARKQVAMERFKDTYAMSLPSRMKLEVYQAAMLIGRGFDPVEAADTVGLDLPELYAQMTPEVERVVKFWRNRTLEEYFSSMIRMIDYLRDTVTDPEVMIKLLKQMEALANRSEDRERWETEIQLREREIRAKEQESDAFAQSVQLSSVVKVETLDLLDVEFEAEDA